MKIIGVIPARMAASRFPGKPLYPIIDRPMLAHVIGRARLFSGWSELMVATCDHEIQDACAPFQIPVVMTSPDHVRCLDRVAEASTTWQGGVDPADVVVCVQGDEPMMHPEMIDAVIAPLKRDSSVQATVLGMQIVDEDLWRNPDTVKIIHDMKGDVLYTSRAPVPYAKQFSAELGALRIYGLFAFRKGFLDTFTRLAPSPLEIKESCDSNRIFDHGYRQRVAPYPFCPSFSVDSPGDIGLVEAAMLQDPYWGRY
jgi:3-deoxy-manno-octulosonate cytidylyltransferase (CMP-KDO synthetase)